MPREPISKDIMHFDPPYKTCLNVYRPKSPKFSLKQMLFSPLEHSARPN